jgi:hypothetical protein
MDFSSPYSRKHHKPYYGQVALFRRDNANCKPDGNYKQDEKGVKE